MDLVEARLWANLAWIRNQCDDITVMLAAHRAQCNRTDHLSTIEQRVFNIVNEINRTNQRH